MRKGYLVTKKKKGMSLVEVILAMALFSILVLGLSGAFSYSVQSSAIISTQTKANYLAEEGLEAVRNIRDAGYSSLVDGNHGLGISGGTWTLDGTSESIDGYTRQIQISTVDANTKKVVSQITWPTQFDPTNTISQTMYLTDWRRIVSIYTATKSGMLVYGDGGTTSDTVRYRIFNGTTGTWNAEQSVGDVDGATTNKALVGAKIYSSATRNEKVLLTKHCNGTNTFIYAQVWNGTTWGNLVQLATYASATCANYQVENFGGVYQQNGNFMAVYGDNTNTPKFRVWNGTTWAAQVSTRSVGGTPYWFIVRARPGTNEVMLVTLDSASDTKNMYFNGGTYTSGNWSAVVTHSVNSAGITFRNIDFEWSTSNTTKGLIVYPEANNDTTISGKIWTANGSGGGTWSAVTNAPAMPSNFQTIDIAPRKGADGFSVCSRDRGSPAPVSYYCFIANNSGVWTTPTNNIVGTGLDTINLQMGFGVMYENSTGNDAITVYADETNTPKLKRLNITTSTWDASATNLTAVSGTAKSVALQPNTAGDHILIMVGNSSANLYTYMWDGANNMIYTYPTDLSFMDHSASGYNLNSQWYDFAWDY